MKHSLSINSYSQASAETNTQKPFKIIDRSKKRKPLAQPLKKYTLGCENRLEKFKGEFEDYLEKQFSTYNGGFVEHYEQVISNITVQNEFTKQRQADINSEPYQGMIENLQKGTVLYRKGHVLNANMLELDEEKMKKKYGSMAVEMQGLKRIVENDKLIPNLVLKQFMEHKRNTSKESRVNSNNQKSQSPQRIPAVKIYQQMPMIKSRISSKQQELSNLASQFGTQNQRDASHMNNLNNTRKNSPDNNLDFFDQIHTASRPKTGNNVPRNML